MVIEIPIVAVHSKEDYSWELYGKAKEHDAILFYSATPIVRTQDVGREQFQGKFYVPDIQALNLYLDLRRPSPSSPSDLVRLLKLEQRDPREVFVEFVREREKRALNRSRSYVTPGHSNSFESPGRNRLFDELYNIKSDYSRRNLEISAQKYFEALRIAEEERPTDSGPLTLRDCWGSDSRNDGGFLRTRGCWGSDHGDEDFYKEV